MESNRVSPLIVQAVVGVLIVMAIMVPVVTTLAPAPDPSEPVDLTNAVGAESVPAQLVQPGSDSLYAFFSDTIDIGGTTYRAQSMWFYIPDEDGPLEVHPLSSEIPAGESKAVQTWLIIRGSSTWTSSSFRVDLAASSTFVTFTVEGTFTPGGGLDKSQSLYHERVPYAFYSASWVRDTGYVTEVQSPMAVYDGDMAMLYTAVGASEYSVSTFKDGEFTAEAGTVEASAEAVEGGHTVTFAANAIGPVSGPGEAGGGDGTLQTLLFILPAVMLAALVAMLVGTFRADGEKTPVQRDR